MSDKTASARSDGVRARRERRERRKQPRQGNASRFNPPPVPVGKTAREAPVLIRGARTDVPVRAKKNPKVRRRYDISLGTTGAEVQLPAMPFVRPSWRWVSASLAVGLLVVLGMMWSHPAFMVQTIEVQGLQRLDAQEVHLVLGLGNAPIFTVDPAVLEHNLLLAFPEFATVEAEVGLPNRVVVRVEERQPVLGWRNEQGLVLVDAQGVSFPARGLVTDAGEDTASGGARLPVVEAPNLVMALETAPETASETAPETAPGTALETALDTAPETGPEGEAAAGQSLNPYVGRQLLSPDQVSAILTVSGKAPGGAVIVFDPHHGIGWQDPAGWVVYFGTDGGDIHAKLEMYAAIVQDLTNRGIRPGLISVEFLHAPYYRMERE